MINFKVNLVESNFCNVKFTGSSTTVCVHVYFFWKRELEK